jgi:hypothetical protein
LLNWKASNSYGWGLLGLGLLLHWAKDPSIEPVMGFTMSPNDFPCMDVIRALVLGSAAQASNHFLSELEVGRLRLSESRTLLIDALSNGFRGPNLQPIGRRLMAFIAAARPALCEAIPDCNGCAASASRSILIGGISN